MAERTPSNDQAAFGVFPQLQRNRSKQDREAAKNVPIDLARGAVAGVLGAPGDIESLVRMLPYLDEKTVLPTSEDIEKRLPLRSETPVSKAATGLGILGGGFYTGPGSPLRVAGALPSAIKRGAQDFALASAAGAPHVVKPKGGNWIGSSVEKGLEPLLAKGIINSQEIPYGPKFDAAIRKRIEDLNQKASQPDYVGGAKQVAEHLERDLQNPRVNEAALNKWVQSNLTNYVKKEMGTPEDPVRKLAEQGISHLPRDLQNVEMTWTPEELAQRRKSFGFPEEETATHPTAKMWEQMADEMIGPHRASDIGENLRAQNPWLEKLNPNDPVYKTVRGLPQALKFDHILDVLRQDVAAGRIRPEQLNKVSMEQAVRRTAEFDEEMARKMAEAQLKVDQGLPVRKEYPEGYKWQELRHTDDAATEAALKYEGNTMGHCVGGYCPDVLAGRTRIFSLRDAKGEPHVTIETRPEPHPIGTSRRGDNFPELSGFEYGSQHTGSGPYNPTSEQKAQIHNRAQELWSTKGTGRAGDIDQFYQQASNEILGPMPERIVQIKGKQNAKPKADYIPYVQDFVKGGKWSDVGDLHNTGLINVGGKYFTEPELTEAAKKYGRMGVQDTPWEVARQRHIEQGIPEDEALRNWVDAFKEGRGRLDIPPDVLPEMKRGGKVSISSNPDTMMLELGNQKMAGGGLAKLLRAAPKSKAEIEAIAQRIAPQMLGDFVRAEKGTQSVAGKTQKQFAKEKEMKHDIRPTGVERALPKPVDIESLKGSVVIGIPGDPTISGQTLHSLNGIPLDSPSPQHGGPLYGLGRDDAFWASGLGAANRVQNLAREAGMQYDAPVLGKYIMMGPESINYAQHFADANLSAINPAKMTKGQIESFNNLVRQGSAKSGPRPSFPGIENPSEAYLHFAIDPELRKHFNALMQMPTVTERHGLPSGTDVRHAITEPDLRDLETGITGKSIGRMRPEVKELNWSEHPTYSHDIPGEFLGSSKYPIPYELSFPDTVRSVRENPKQAPHEFGSLKMVGPRQIIDQQMIDEIKQYEEQIKKLTGKKKGGAIHKAAGGAITGDDLIIEERPL